MESNLTSLEDVKQTVMKLELSDEVRQQLIRLVKKPILTNHDFAALFQIDVRSCHRWRLTLHIPYFKISGRIYYFWTAVLPVLLAKQVVK